MANTDEIRYGLDRLIATGKRIFGWGWVAHAAHTARSVHLRVHGDGWERRLQADIGLARPDVSDAFPDLQNASSSGFIVTGYLPDPGARGFVLEIDFEDGTRAELEVTPATAVAQAKRRKWQLGYLARAVWRRLKRGDLAGIVRRAKAQSYAAATLDDWGVIDDLVPTLRKYGQVWLVFDHNMGGGANQYRRALIAARVAAGDAVMLCTYNLPMLEYRLHVYLPQEAERIFSISSFLVLEPVFEEMRSLQVFVNSPVSFEDPLMLAEWLARMRLQHPRSKLVVTAHDYFAACPSFVLLDAKGRHCGIPGPAECAACLRDHEASYVSLSPPTEIGPWRASWGRCLAAADEVRCFSTASERLMRKAYPGLASERVTVLPHKIDFTPARAPRIDARAPMVVGVVGEISPQKGAFVVTGLVELIEAAQLDVRVVVVGSLDVVCNSPKLKVTGRYKREQLAELIESHGINMFLFPSVWPETFSYVVAELMALHVPIVAFDLGAPAERLRNYALGRLCPEVSARAALETLLAFHDERRVAQATRVA